MGVCMFAKAFSMSALLYSWTMTCDMKSCGSSINEMSTSTPKQIQIPVL